jgi:hypothetical protein
MKEKINVGYARAVVLKIMQSSSSGNVRLRLASSCISIHKYNWLRWRWSRNHCLSTGLAYAVLNPATTENTRNTLDSMILRSPTARFISQRSHMPCPGCWLGECTLTASASCGMGCFASCGANVSGSESSSIGSTERKRHTTTTYSTRVSYT